MKSMDLEQLPQHNYDLGVRHESGSTLETLVARYYELVMDQPLNADEALSDFEKMLTALIESNAGHLSLLRELGSDMVEPIDALKIKEEERIPSEPLLDEIQQLRGTFDDIAERYAEEISNMNLFAPYEAIPDQTLDRKYRLKIARFVIGSCVLDNRDELEDE